MAHLVTGYAGKAHIKSADDGAFNAAFFGAGQYVLDSGNDNCFAGSIIDNNTVRILDGEGLMYGRHFRIEPNTYEDMVIETGTTGMNRIDLICMTYEKDAENETESAYLEVIKGTETSGTAVMPEYTNGNILQGASLNQMPLYKVTVKGVVLSKIEPVFAKLLNYEKMAEVYLQKHENLDEKYYQQFEERIENAVDEMTEIPNVVLAQVETNTAKLEKLKNIGANLIEEQFYISCSLTAGEENVVYTFDTSFDEGLEERAIYQWMINSSLYNREVRFVNISSESGITNFANITGFIEVTLKNRNGMPLAYQKCPLLPYNYGYAAFCIQINLQGFYMSPLKFEDLYLNSFSDCYITMKPYVCEKVFQAESDGVEWWDLKDITPEIEFNARFKLTAQKIGYDMSALPNGGELPDVSEGTTNYEELDNKPTINGVELTGDLTEEDLGIECEKDFDKASGENIHLTDAFENKVVEFSLFGKATQDGEPTPDNPVEIEVAGSSGSITVTTTNEDSTKNITATIPTPNGLAGIPVDSNGNYTDSNGQQWICDEVVKYADGSGEYIKRIGVIESYNSETITEAYLSTTGDLSAGAKVLYQLPEEVRTPLTAEQLTEIEKLHTFNPVTNISNDSDCGMNVMYVCGENGAMISRTIDGLLEKIASLSGGGESPEIVFSDTEPETVEENTIVYVYETE